jgi:hypothetical protein
MNVGDEVGTDVRIRIESIQPEVQATITAMDDFWKNRSGDGTAFAVGMRLKFLLTSTGTQGPLYKIESPQWLPWFILGERGGKLYFEHYR